MNIVNREYFDSLENVLKCKICDYILNNPFDCEKCGHTFCYDCINNIVCPFKCKGKFIKQSSNGIKILLSNLIFYCPLKNCDKEIPYNEYISHVNYICHSRDFYRIDESKFNKLVNHKINIDLNKNKNFNVMSIENIMEDKNIDNFNLTNPNKIKNKIHSNNININIPVIISNPQNDLKNIQNSKNRIKTEIESDIDHFFKDLLYSKKKKKRMNPNETLTSSENSKKLNEIEIFKIIKIENFTIFSSFLNYNQIHKNISFNNSVNKIEEKNHYIHIQKTKILNEDQLMISENSFSINSLLKNQSHHKINTFDDNLTNHILLKSYIQNLDISKFEFHIDNKYLISKSIKLKKESDNILNYNEFKNRENLEETKFHKLKIKNLKKNIDQIKDVSFDEQSYVNNNLPNLSNTVVLKNSTLLDYNHKRELIRQRVIEMRKKTQVNGEISKKIGSTENKYIYSTINEKNDITNKSDFGEAIKEKIFERSLTDRIEEELEYDQNSHIIKKGEFPMILKNKQNEVENNLKNVNTPKFTNKLDDNQKIGMQSSISVVNRNINFENNLTFITNDTLSFPKGPLNKDYIKSNSMSRVDFSKENLINISNNDLNIKSDKIIYNTEKEDFLHIYNDEIFNNPLILNKEFENILSYIKSVLLNIQKNFFINKKEIDTIIKEMIVYLKSNLIHHTNSQNMSEKVSINDNKEETDKNKSTVLNIIDKKSIFHEESLVKIIQENKKSLNNFYDKLILLMKNKFSNLIFQKLYLIDQKLNKLSKNNENDSNNFCNIKGLEICSENKLSSLNIPQMIERNYIDIIDYMRINFKEIKQYYRDILNEELGKYISKIKSKDIDLNVNNKKNESFNIINKIFDKKKLDLSTSEIITKNNHNNDDNNFDFHAFTGEDTTINSLNLESLNQIKEFIEKFYSFLQQDLLQSIQLLTNKIDIDFEKKLNNIIGEIYKHKWCYSCERINYNFSFLKCDICWMEYCISCTFKCKKCDNIYCKYCVICSLCGDYYCTECRSICNSKTCNNKFNYLNYLALEEKRNYPESNVIDLDYFDKNYTDNFSNIQSIINEKENLKFENVQKKKIILNLVMLKSMLIKIRFTTKNQESDKYKKTIYKRKYYSKINKLPENKFIEVSQNFEICENCSNTCKKCRKIFCKNSCLFRCHVCLNNVCSTCAKHCYICNNYCCQICTENYKFAICYCCNNYTCISCLENCEICNLEPCSNCVFNCEYCRKKGCNINKKSCLDCKKNFCDSCANDLKFNYCTLCKTLHCDKCSENNITKCINCKLLVCLKCYSNCRKCKDVYCKNCKIRCQNCSDVICNNCVFSCVCEKISFCQNCLFDIKPICSHECVQFINGTSNFSGRKTRSKLPMPESFEAKLFLNSLDSKNILIGITDNCNWEDDSLSYVDDIWGFKPITGEKYSSKKGVEKYINVQAKERDFILVTKIKEELFFRINFEMTPMAFKLDKNLTELYLYIENDKALSKTKIGFIYIRKI